MAGGFLGLPNMMPNSPLGGLTALAQDGAGQGAPAPMPEPATTGAIPPPAGGGSSRGLGDMLGDAFSGRGLMGARPGDDKVDPTTGATAGQARQVSMQSMMGMGLTLLAAGMRQTDDSRAAILSNAPKMLAGGAGDLNNFAKMRLEMAQAKLKEREAANAEERTKRWGALMGGSGAATGVTPTAPAAAATPEAAPGAATAPGAVQAQPVVAQPAVAAPVAPTGTGNVMDGVSPGTRAILGALGPEKGMEKLLDIRRGLDEQETIGEPRTDPTTGKVVADKMKNGRKVGIVVIGDQAEFAGPASVDPQTGRKGRDIMRGGVPIRNESLGDVIKPMTEEDGKRITRTGGVVTGITDIVEDPQDREERTASVGIRTKRAAALNEGRANIEQLNGALPRLAQAEKDVRDKKTITGFGADYREQASTLLGSLNILSDAGREELRKTGNVDGILKQAGGEFAKQYYGPQISNSDVTNAQKAIGGLKSGDYAVVADAIGRIRKGYAQKIDSYNTDVDNHNSRLSGIRSEGLRGDLEARKVDRQRAPDEYSEKERADARAEIARRAAKGAR